MTRALGSKTCIYSEVNSADSPFAAVCKIYFLCQSSRRRTLHSRRKFLERRGFHHTRGAVGPNRPREAIRGMLVTLSLADLCICELLTSGGKPHDAHHMYSYSIRAPINVTGMPLIRIRGTETFIHKGLAGRTSATSGRPTVSAR